MLWEEDRQVKETEKIERQENQKNGFTKADVSQRTKSACWISDMKVASDVKKNHLYKRAETTSEHVD